MQQLSSNPFLPSYPVETTRMKSLTPTVVRDSSWAGKLRSLVKEKMQQVGEFFQKVAENAGCKNHMIAMRSSLAHVKKLASSLFKKLGEGWNQTAKTLSENKVFRKLKDTLDYLQNCNLTFVRKSETPIFKKKIICEENYEQLKKNLSKLELDGALEAIIRLLKAIAKIPFQPNEYEIRNAMVAEILTKHLMPLPLTEKLRFPIPCFDSQNKPVVVTYEVTHRLNLGDSHIPVYVFLPVDQEEGESAPALLLFRGTRLKAQDAADFKAIIENLNNVGPAKGVYDQFKPKLEALFKKWAKDQHFPLFRVLGYSQGGVLGQRTSVDFYPYIDKNPLNASIFFNSPAVELEYIKRWNQLATDSKPCVLNYLITRDLVSKRGSLFIGDVFEIDPHVEENFLQAHLGARSLAHSHDLELYVVDNEQEAESYSRKLVNQVMSSSSIEHLYKLASYGLKTVSEKKDSKEKHQYQMAA